MECRVFETFQKNRKIFKIPKRPKIIPKSIQTCFELVLGQIFRKIFLPSVPWRFESSKIFLKIKKFSKFQKCPKSFPKVSKRVLNMFWGKFSENFLPSVPWRVKSSKLFKKIEKLSKFQKGPKTFPKVSKRVLNMFWGEFFEKLFFAQCSMETSKIFKKKFSKLQKCPKLFPKISKRVLNLFWVKFFENFFLPSVPWRVEFSKIFKKKYFQNSKNAQKCSQKYPNVF